MKIMHVIKILKSGEGRVLNGKEGMTFIVHNYTETPNRDGWNAHIRDYRYAKDSAQGFQIWSLSPGDYELIEE